ncbi:DUF2007 domain-containing protein [Pedobacter montanisoli]|uniref:DUF2007 domain-containing protein n=1 Tax=Pedobacter montanisoli TaxID=2923277 RepID=A0ABS9ZUM7_9SPHI|nr:DUF2007 domain-containing protein [Pedobacter montanisoli]MCJ0742309.1 DUF2007 domain-containing protein [Pedobacter montanisoli]
MGADKIIIYKNYENPIEAQMTLTRLRDAGFECFLSGENTAWLRPMLDASISGIQLHVFEKDVSEISRFLQEDLPLED